MIPSFDSDIRARLAEAVGAALGTTADARKIRLPARSADASFRPPQGVDPADALNVDFGLFWGAPLVAGVQVVNGWLLFQFSAAFYSALVSRINADLPLPAEDGGEHVINRMLALARHEGDGCPDLPAMHRALLFGIAAYQSSAARKKAVQAAESLFSSVSPRERPALLSRSGALGGALARLLFLAR